MGLGACIAESDDESKMLDDTCGLAKAVFNVKVRVRFIRANVQ